MKAISLPGWAPLRYTFISAEGAGLQLSWSSPHGEKVVLRIDGSTGEGGGQILRTSLALAAVMGRGVEIFNVRRGRARPGLMMQHLTAARALAAVSGGEVEGGEQGSLELSFRPGPIKPGCYTFDVAEERGSAGSTGLVLQALLPALLLAEGESRLTLKGGTHTRWSPPTTYLEKVFCPALALMGGGLSLQTERWGWYPKGGGIVHATVQPVLPLKPVNLIERGELESAHGISLISNLPFHIAERQRRQAAQRIKAAGVEARLEASKAPSTGPGTFLMLWLRFSCGIAGFSALGERGKRAEEVADEACDELVTFLHSGAAVDAHLADQLIVYMALAQGESAITTTERTLHLTTNIWTVEQFLPVKFRVEETGKGAVRIAVKGVGQRIPASRA